MPTIEQITQAIASLTGWTARTPHASAFDFSVTLARRGVKVRTRIGSFEWLADEYVFTLAPRDVALAGFAALRRDLELAEKVLQFLNKLEG